MQPLLPQTAGCTYLKMIQWLNVRAVGAIKASPFEGRTPSRLLFLCLFLFLQLPPHRRVPPFLRPPPDQADVADLVTQIWATLSARGSPLLSNWIFLPTVIRVPRTEETL